MKETAVEEMNMAIAEYMGGLCNNGVLWDFEKHPADYIRGRHVIYSEDLWYHSRFSWLMPVWQKLRGDIKHRISPNTIWGDLNTLIENAILDTNITTAHRLIYEAIQLIKTK